MFTLLSLLIAQDLPAQAPPAPPAQDLPATRLDWAWLAGSTWIVPPADLPAMQMDPKEDAVRWVVDQTVWRFQGVRTGYVWGYGVAMLRAPNPESPGPAEAETQQCLTILGTVTPDGAFSAPRALPLRPASPRGCSANRPRSCRGSESPAARRRAARGTRWPA